MKNRDGIISAPVFSVYFPVLAWESSKEAHSVQEASRDVGPQVPTWMAEREQTLLAPLWWRQLSTVHWMLGLAFMF